MTSWLRPSFLDSEYYVGEVTGGYFLEGVSQELVEEYNAFFCDINEMDRGVSVENVKDYKIVPVAKDNGMYQAQLYKTANVEGGLVLSSSNMVYVTQDYATEEQAIQDAEAHYNTIK
jgi:nitrate reductase NapAB chaperone NapD